MWRKINLKVEKKISFLSKLVKYIAINLTNKDKDDVFVYNGWMFSSSPSLTPFDHPVYDIWLIKCY